jgi:hypothetical protein
VTKWIRLRETLSGGRADGRPWPVAGEVVDVPDWEYDHCIAAGWAEHADPPAPPKAAKAKEPEKAKAKEPEKEPAKAHEPEKTEAHEPEKPAGGKVGLYEGDQVVLAKAPEPETAPEPPRPSDPKQDWVDYAADRGLARDKAEAMSKADLMSRYGGRL